LPKYSKIHTPPCCSYAFRPHTEKNVSSGHDVVHVETSSGA